MMMSKLGHWFSRAWLVLVVAGIVILLDQWTKTLVRQSIPDYTALIPIPVSYTHLDVYKRQAQRRRDRLERFVDAA